MFGLYSLPEPPLEPPEPKIVCRCEHCSDIIYEGDDIVEIDGLTYHRDCFMDCAAEILFKNYGATARVAEE